MRVEAKLTTVQRVTFLMALDALQESGSDQIAELATRMTELSFSAGEIINRETVPEERLYLVVDGMLEYTRGDVVIEQATHGMGLGIPDVMGIPRPGVVKAVVPTHVLSLTREEFIDAVMDDPMLALGVIRALTKRLLAFGQQVEELVHQLNAKNQGEYL